VGWRGARVVRTGLAWRVVRNVGRWRATTFRIFREFAGGCLTYLTFLETM
jgi:hypothetical protein